MDKELTHQLKQVLTSLQLLLPKPFAEIDWTVCHAANWRRHSFSGYMEPLESIEQIALDDLLGIEEQKRIIEENTCQFLAGYPANNALLWGTRGTGKSSLIRAILNNYASQGLRIVQVDKHDLIHLPDIVDSIKRLPYRFIIFSDDISFEVGESSYKMLKSALDGGVYAPPDNVLIYVTSNRRHLLRRSRFHGSGKGRDQKRQTVEKRHRLRAIWHHHRKKPDRLLQSQQPGHQARGV